MEKSTVKLTDDQKTKIITLSKEAQSFLRSVLFLEIESWIKQEKEGVTRDIVYDNRNATEKNLTRAEFIERRSAYYINLDTFPVLIKQWAQSEAELKKFEEAQNAAK